MQLTHILTVGFAVLAHAQRYRPHGYWHQERDAALVADADIDSDCDDSDSDSDSDSSPDPGSGSFSGTASHDGSKEAAVVALSVPQSSDTGSASSTTTSSSSGSTSSSSSSSSTSSDNAVGSTASFTQYSSCNTATASCAWYSSTGYNAAISQAVYGGAPGTGPSAACGICWKLTPNHAGANEIVVKVNNLCPDDGNPLCAQPANADINFDLCEDSGAAAALFGSSGTQQVNGTAAIVDCSEWSGGAKVCAPGVSSC